MKRILILLLSLFAFFSPIAAQTNISPTSDSIKELITTIRQNYKAGLHRLTYYKPQSKTKPYDFIHDYEKIFSVAEEASLDSIVTNFEKQTSIEIAIITIDTILVAEMDFDSLTLLIAKKWGIGKGGKDNGVLIGISTAYRRIRIQNGFGIEKVITNDQTKEIIDNVIVPYYKKDEYFNGTKAGLISLINHLK
jgi:uncharacterized protein